MKPIFQIVLLNLLFLNSIFSQSYFKLRLVNSPQNKVKEIIILNYEEIEPNYINDSIALYSFKPELPINLLVLIERKSRWYTMAWLSPKNDTVELIVDFSTRTSGLKKPKEWDMVFKKYITFSDSDDILQADSVASNYISKHNDSYLSLWFLSHGVAFENRPLKTKLFNQLDKRFIDYNEYKEIKHDLGERRIPKAGEPFKEFTLLNINQKQFESRNLCDKIIILHFWTNNCAACVKGMDELASTYGLFDTSKVVFVSISLDENKNLWQLSKTSHKIKWANLWQSGGLFGELSLNYNLKAMPLFVIFNKEKRLHLIIEGEDIYSIKKAIADLSI